MFPDQIDSSMDPTLSARSQDFQEVYLAKNSKNLSFQDKFKTLEKNMRIFLDNASFLTPKPQTPQKDKSLETLLWVLKGIKKECEVIRESQEDKSQSFLRDYKEKLARLENEMHRFEQKTHKNHQETFNIFHLEGKFQEDNDQFSNESRVKVYEKTKGEEMKGKIVGNKENFTKKKKKTVESKYLKKTQSVSMNKML